MTLVVGLLVLAISIAVVLSRASTRLAGSNDVGVTERLLQTPAGGTTLCRNGEALPAGTAAVRLSLQGDGAPHVSVSAFAGKRRVASGTRAAGWQGSSVVVPLHQTVRRDVVVRLCATVAPGDSVEVLGADVRGRPNGFRVDYLRAGRESWWALAPAIVARIGRGHAWSGPSVALAVAALTLAAVALALRELLRVDAGGDA